VVDEDWEEGGGDRRGKVVKEERGEDGAGVGGWLLRTRRGKDF